MRTQHLAIACLGAALVAAPPCLAQSALIVAGANSSPNTLINATFNGSALTFGAEIPSGGTTTGTPTNLAFNQVRFSPSNVPGCTLIAQTNSGSNNISIYSISAGGTIAAVAGSPFLAAAGLQSLAWAPDGGALYAPLGISGASTVTVFPVSCSAGSVVVGASSNVSLTGFNLLRDVEVIGTGAGSHLCVSGSTSNNIGCFAINGTTRLPSTTPVNTVTVTNVRGMRIASNGCGVAGVGTTPTVQGFTVNAGGAITATNTAASATNARYGAISNDGTFAAFGGFGTAFTLFRVSTACNLTLVGSNAAAPANSLVEYMEFDSQNRLYVADSLANQIRVFAPTTSAIGAAVATSLTNHPSLSAPGGIDVLLTASPDPIFASGFETPAP